MTEHEVSDPAAEAGRDALHEAARRIVESADVSGIAELHGRGMTRSITGRVAAPGRDLAVQRSLNRALRNASFGRLATLIREKAERAVRAVISVEAATK